MRTPSVSRNAKTAASMNSPGVKTRVYPRRSTCVRAAQIALVAAILLVSEWPLPEPTQENPLPVEAARNRLSLAGWLVALYALVFPLAPFLWWMMRSPTRNQGNSCDDRDAQS